MSIRTLEDAVVRLTTDVFGEDVSYTPYGASPVTIKGVFDNAWVDVEGVLLLKPVLRIKLDDLEDPPAKGDQVEVRETDYAISESRLDGHGGTTLILQKV